MHGAFESKVWPFVAERVTPLKELRWSRTMLTSPSPRAVREISQSSILAELGRLAFPSRLLERSVEHLTLRHIWRPWTSFRLGGVFSSLGACLCRKYRIAARIAGPVIILCASHGFAAAQDATWVGATSDWNTPGNWNPNVVPTRTATFNPSTPTSITFSQGSMMAPTTIQTLSFNASGFVFGLTPIDPESSVFVAITGVGIQCADVQC